MYYERVDKGSTKVFIVMENLENMEVVENNEITVEEGVETPTQDIEVVTEPTVAESIGKVALTIVGLGVGLFGAKKIYSKVKGQTPSNEPKEDLITSLARKRCEKKGLKVSQTKPKKEKKEEQKNAKPKTQKKNKKVLAEK